MKFKITDEFIDKGKQGDCMECPTALTINTVLKDHVRAKVIYGHIQIVHAKPRYEKNEDGENEYAVFDLLHDIYSPKELDRWIRDYDEREESEYEDRPIGRMEELEFEINIPQEYLK